MRRGKIIAGVVVCAALVVVTVALASSHTATTGSATNVGQTTATLNGSTTNATSCYFQYGQTTAYGSTASVSPCDTAAADVANLSPGATYHFRMVANDGSGEVFGNDATFATGTPSAPSATTGAASGVSQTGATLNGSVGNATSCSFQWGPTLAYGNTVALTSCPGDVAAPLTGLSPGVTYHFRVAAANSAGTVYGGDASFTTGTPTPPIVTTGEATAIGVSTAKISGSVNPNGKATSYYFEYGTTLAYGTRIPVPSPSAGAGTAAVAVSADLSNLSSGFTYHFRLVAENPDGPVPTGDRTFKTIVPPLTGASSAITDKSAKITGTVFQNPAAPTTWYFEYGITDFGSKTTANTTPAGAGTVDVSADLGGLGEERTYKYRLVIETGGVTVPGDDRTFKTLTGPRAKPKAPDLVVVKTANKTSVKKGETIRYSITVSTKGAEGATGVKLTDQLPAGLTVVSSTVDRGSGCTGTTTVTCNLDFLIGNQTATVLIVALVSDQAKGELVNVASVAAREGDLNAADNRGRATVKVEGEPLPGTVATKGHPGPPVLAIASKQTRLPLNAKRKTGLARIFSAISVDEAATLRLTLKTPGSRKRMPMMKGSVFGKLKTRANKSELVFKTDEARKTIAFRLDISLKRLKKGTTYLIVIRATDTSGEKARLEIPFMR